MPETDASIDSIERLPESLRALARRGVIKRYERDALLIREGEHGDTIFIILSGSVEAFCTDGRRRKFIFGCYGPGEYIGEMSLDGGPRSASIATLEPTVCALITRYTLREHIRSHPDFAFELIERVIRRVRVATENAKGLALLDNYGRLVRVLSALATSRSDGARAIVPKPTHAELAGRIGSSREMVTRLLNDLEQGGYVDTREEQLVLLRPLPSSW